MLTQSLQVVWGICCIHPQPVRQGRGWGVAEFDDARRTSVVTCTKDREETKDCQE